MARRNSNDYAVVWPRSAKAVEVKPLARRLDKLEGKTIAFLWDDLFRGDEIWPMLEERARPAASATCASSITTPSARPTATTSSACSPSCRASSSRAGGRRGRLRHGLLRELHARRVAGQRDCRAGRSADRRRCVVRASSARPRRRRWGSGYPEPGRWRTVPGHVDVQTSRSCARNVVGGDGRSRSSATSRARSPRSQATCASPIRRTSCSRAASRRSIGCFLRERLERRPADRAADHGARSPSSCAFTDLRGRRRRSASCCPTTATATVWNVAVNGVMAGCRPEYMPILVALVEAMADPRYGVEHSGNTPGAETLIMLNGPLIKELGFNYEQGALRDGFQANTIDRALLAALPAQRRGLPAAPERQGHVRQHLARRAGRERGRLRRSAGRRSPPTWAHRRASNAVTISRFTGGNVIVSVFGDSAEKLLPYLGRRAVDAYRLGADVHRRHGDRHLPATAGAEPDDRRDHRQDGLTKADVQNWLFEHARMPAHQFEKYHLGLDQPGAGQAHAERLGAARQDPARLRRQRSGSARARS